MPFKNLQNIILLVKNGDCAFHKNNSVVLITYNPSNTEQLVMCTGGLRHTDKGIRFRSFVVPGDSPALLGMPDIELLSLLKIICEVMGGQQANKKFNFQTRQPSIIPSCKEKKASL